jgi:hypothetical protein
MVRPLLSASPLRAARRSTGCTAAPTDPAPAGIPGARPGVRANRRGLAHQSIAGELTHRSGRRHVDRESEERGGMPSHFDR